MSGDDKGTAAQPAPSHRQTEMRSGRWNTVGVPAEKSKDFKGSSRRLLQRLETERPAVALILGCTVASVTLLVVGPKILGNATTLVFDGLVRSMSGGPGIDLTALRNTLLLVLVLFVGG